MGSQGQPAQIDFIPISVPVSLAFIYFPLGRPASLGHCLLPSLTGDFQPSGAEIFT
jgi:hypothetical protein